MKFRVLATIAIIIACIVWAILMSPSVPAQ